MKRVLVLAAAVAGLVSIACDAGVARNVPLAARDEIAASESCDPAVARERVRAASVRVRTWYGEGTAFHIGDGRYVTARHVVEGERFIDLYAGLERIDAEVVYEDESIDIAVIESARAIPNVLAFAEDVQPGDSGWSYGFSRRSGVPREFVVMAREDWPAVYHLLADDLGLDDGDIRLFRGVADPGDSGSAVVSDCGEVVAVLTAVFNPYFAEAYVVLGISQMAAREAAISAFD